MKINTIKYSQLSIFPKLIRDYLSSSSALNSFFKYPFDFTAFRQIIVDKKFPDKKRQALADSLVQQYESIKTTEAVKSNIDKLRYSNTFTVTTAHQPVLFTGPLYVIYKIVSAINITERLSQEYPDKHFVPVYYMGAEDHDFEEINHTWLNGEKLVWMQESKGAVGRLSTKNILPLIEQAENHLKGKPCADEIIKLLKDAYSTHSTLAEATLHLIDKLFGEYGLVVLIPDNKKLKQLFAPVLGQELSHNHSFNLTQQTNKELLSLGYEIQVNPREINLFYLAENTRERIVLNQQSDKYEVLNSSLSFSKEEILKMAQESPEYFSPNVMLRPLYQETILPNLAYVGGAGELSYWLQQKRIFDHYGENFPMLVLRNSAMIIDSNTSKKMNKAGIQFSDLFNDQETITQNFVRMNSNGALDIATEKENVNNVFERIKEKAISIDPTLAGAIEAQKAAFLKGLEGIETKFMRAEKRNFETAINQIKSVKSKLFPDNTLQERVENFLPWYAQYGSAFLQSLEKEFNPFRKEFILVVDDGEN